MTPTDVPKLDMRARDDRDSRRSLLDLINASWTTQAIAASVELRIPDLLADGSRDLVALARAIPCHPPSLQRLLNALASLDLVEQRNDGTFALTRTGKLLQTDASESLAWWSLLCGGRSWAYWGGLADSVRRGQSARRRSGSSDDFAIYDNDRAAGDAFNRAMSNLTKPIAEAIVNGVGFNEHDLVVDVGGGHGQLLATILAARPGLCGVLFDLEHAISQANRELARAGVAQQCQLVSGNFFETIPGGADVYLLKSVLHDWDDEHCSIILKQCERAMSAGHPRASRLLVIERIRPERFAVTPRDQAIARSDLNMLVSLGGRERTALEYQALLDAAGLRVVRISELPNEFSVLEAWVASSTPSDSGKRPDVPTF